MATPAPASLAGITPEEAARAVGELVRANLLAEHRPGRFSSHDLLRAYAVDLARSTDPEDERRAALLRALDHHLHTAHGAAMLLNPNRDTIELSEPGHGVVPETLTGPRPAQEWFNTEHGALLAAIDRAASSGFALHAWQLAWATRDFFQRRGHWHDWVATQQVALDAAGELADERRLAHACRSLAHASSTLRRYDDAHRHLRRALTIYMGLGDPLGLAHTHRAISRVLDEEGRFEEALGHDRKALGYYREIGHREGEASALNSLGWHRAQLGRHRRALADCRRALAVHREIGNRSGEADTWDSLGYAHHHLGELAAAGTCYRQAIDLYRELGYRLGEASTLVRLGDTYEAEWRPDGAGQARRAALAILEQLDHPDARRVRATLGPGHDHR